MATTTMTSQRRSFVLWTVVPGGVLLTMAFVLGAWILLRGDGPFVVDSAWNEFLAAWESVPALYFSRAMNVLGGTWFGIIVVPAAAAIGLFLVRRPWAATYFIAASISSASLVQVLKHLFGRARPTDIIVTTDFGSFPSGHVANAATLATVLVILFPRAWAVIVGTVWVVLMAFSRTYLHAHWLSDTLGGAMIGVAAALLMASVFTVPLLHDRARLGTAVRHVAA